MKKVLIVEDDSMLSEIYSKKFSVGGFEVINAFTGLEAVKKAQSEKPDFILLDLVIPEKDGFEVLKTIKEDLVLKNIKVVILSNLSHEEDLEKAKNLGADGFLVKAANTPQQIVDEIRKMDLI